MKLGKILVYIVATAQMSIIAAEQKPIDCEQLAQYIKSEMNTLLPCVFQPGEEGKLWYKYMLCYGSKNNRFNCHYEKASCTYSDNIHLMNRPEGKDIAELSYSITILAQYKKALEHCVMNSPTACPLAKEMIQTLQNKQDLTSSCQIEYQTTFEACRQKQVDGLKREEQRKQDIEQLKRYIQKTGH